MVGPFQLWRMSYPDGAVSRLTNDLNSYLGVSLDGDRNSLVTSRSDTRAALWVGEAAGTNSAEVASPTLVGGRPHFSRLVRQTVWYDTITNGRPAIASLLPGAAAPVEIALDAYGAVATSDGKAIVFMKTGAPGMWRAEADGRHARQLESGEGSPWGHPRATISTSSFSPSEAESNPPGSCRSKAVIQPKSSKRWLEVEASTSPQMASACCSFRRARGTSGCLWSANCPCARTGGVRICRPTSATSGLVGRLTAGPSPTSTRAIGTSGRSRSTERPASDHPFQGPLDQGLCLVTRRQAPGGRAHQTTNDIVLLRGLR